MKKLICSFARDESGVTAIEYALIASGVGVAAVAVLGLVGEQITATFNDVLDALTGSGT